MREPAPIPTIDAAIREAMRNRDAAEWAEDIDIRIADFWQAEVDHLMAERARGELFAAPF